MTHSNSIIIPPLGRSRRFAKCTISTHNSHQTMNFCSFCSLLMVCRAVSECQSASLSELIFWGLSLWPGTVCLPELAEKAPVSASMPRCLSELPRLSHWKSLVAACLVALDAAFKISLACWAAYRPSAPSAAAQQSVTKPAGLLITGEAEQMMLVMTFAVLRCHLSQGDRSPVPSRLTCAPSDRPSSRCQPERRHQGWRSLPLSLRRLREAVICSLAHMSLGTCQRSLGCRGGVRLKVRSVSSSTILQGTKQGVERQCVPRGSPKAGHTGSR